MNGVRTVKRSLRVSLSNAIRRNPVASRRSSNVCLHGSSYTARSSSVGVQRSAHLQARSRRHLSSSVSPMSEPREAMDFDVVIVGAGPAGMASAIRLKQIDPDLNVCVVEKGAEVGSHILSGNVFNPKSLKELMPDWKEKGAPLETAVTKDTMLFLPNNKTAISMPVPPVLDNHGNYIISLGGLVKWMGEQAEALGVEIYPGFSASEVLYDESDRVVGIATSDMGVGKDGQPKDTFTRGMELRAKQTVFAEGARGSLSETIMKKYNLRANADPQTYGLGMKEVWEVGPEQFQAGLVQHTLGWPLDRFTYGGSFLYHQKPNKILLGYVVGLDYSNPYISPYEEFQRFKTHPKIRRFLEGGECVSYGARVINEGGFQSLPKLTFPGGLLVGCSAGFLNVPQIKGSHYAMKSGIVAAEAVAEAMASKPHESGLEVTQYETRMKESWVYKELKQVRNVHPGFKYGLVPGMVNSGFSLMVSGGTEPWTFRNKKTDAEKTEEARLHRPIAYPKPDGKLTFDILTNLQRSGTYHDDQPSHLKIKEDKADIPKNVSFQKYAGPESRFCPAKVYEYVEDEAGKPQLVINAQNCLHCKTCGIKTPEEYINWTVPEGGGGPSYAGAM